MNIIKLLLTTTITLFALSAITACEQGPAEDTGEKVDEVITDAGNAIEDACEELKDKVKSEDKDC